MKIKVVCITHDYKGPWSSFSIRDFVKISEWYDAYEHEDRYTIFNEFGYVKCDLAKGYFKTIDEIREEKLNAICL